VSFSIRPATPDDHLEIMRLFDGALLETDRDRINRQLTGSRGCILVAGADRPQGAISLSTETIDDRPTEWADAVHVSAIAVRRSRRRHGIGRALVEAAVEWAAPRPVSATFDDRVRGFYRSCGFEIETHDGRLWAIRAVD